MSSISELTFKALQRMIGYDGVRLWTANVIYSQGRLSRLEICENMKEDHAYSRHTVGQALSQLIKKKIINRLKWGWYGPNYKALLPVMFTIIEEAEEKAAEWG